MNNNNTNSLTIRPATISRVIDILINGIVLQVPEDTMPAICLQRNNNDQVVFKYNIYGKFSEIDFLSKIYQLESMRSHDSRFDNAYRDIYQHTIMNNNWNDGWVFSDPRFKLNSKENFIRFLTQIFHQNIRDDLLPWRIYFEKINLILKDDGFELILTKDEISGWEICELHACDRIELPNKNCFKFSKLEFIGEGSYAKVFRYTDEFYGMRYIVKRLKFNAPSKDAERFKYEFDTLKALNSPYIVKVYCFDENRMQYVMEYADCTLSKYLEEHNNFKSTGVFDLDRFRYEMNCRISIIAQTSKAINYVHSKKLFHRDISVCNVLILKYDDALVVKLSDFGLVKSFENQLTSSQSIVKGSLNDSSSLKIKGFANYNLDDEIYALTNLFAIIISGRFNLSSFPEHVKKFCIKGLKHDRSDSFKTVDELKDAAINCILSKEQIDYYQA